VLRLFDGTSAVLPHQRAPSLDPVAPFKLPYALVSMCGTTASRFGSAGDHTWGHPSEALQPVALPGALLRRPVIEDRQGNQHASRPPANVAVAVPDPAPHRTASGGYSAV
jgi:hypothetical protein